MATTSSHRAWEMGSAPSASNATPRGQLPSITTLTNALPNGPTSVPLQSPTSASNTTRDSGAWSSQPQSTRSSAYSTGTGGFQFPSNINSSHTSPNRFSNSSQPGITSHPFDPTNAPNSTGTQASPGFAPIPQSLGLPNLNQYHDPNRQSQEFPPQESRRSSIGSQMNQGLNGLHINGNASPYGGSTNHSQTSLAQNLHQNLQRERGINQVPNGTRNSRSSGQLPVSPLSPHAGAPRMPFTPRIAPPIGANPRSDIYSAPVPVPGQAYAFPDDDREPGPDAPRASNSVDEPHSTPGKVSRRDSGHTSITSSIVTSDSRLPPGQRTLDESVDMPGTHHHSLQHKQVSDLNGDADMMSNDGNSPYSRTPALRVSHKMAERKRRSEMKDLFENLRSQIPSNQGSKSSKWEILTKASDYIKVLETHVQSSNKAESQLHRLGSDYEATRVENDTLRLENQRLLQDMQRLQQHQQQPPPLHHPPPPPPMYPPPTQYNGHPALAGPEPSRSLPPLTNGIPGASSMQGVQYSHDRR